MNQVMVPTGRGMPAVDLSQLTPRTKVGIVCGTMEAHVRKR